tara:strand:- start:70 stop:699 length:630 start_codon:yes stop_codon:yes gene_type:complete
MQQGWIKIHRQLLEWEWYDDLNVKVLFFHLLLKANHKPKKYKGKIIEVGQLITGLEVLSTETSLSVQKIRTALTKLKSTNEITIKSSSKGTVIQVVNYKKYQVVTNEPTNDQQTNNKPSTTNKNIKNIKNNINERKEAFKIELEKFNNDYPKPMLIDFYEYWCEHSPNDKKMRFEKQTSFAISRRLKTWHRRSTTNYTGKNITLPKYGN